MIRFQTLLFTSLAMIAFAGNSLLCRAALKQTSIDPASFTSIRILAGALTLALLIQLRELLRGRPRDQLREKAHSVQTTFNGDWTSALALFVYAACFSYAYVSLAAATGALLLFGAVQFTMIGAGLQRGERLTLMQSGGLLCAFAGVAGLLLPSLAAPPLLGSALMLSAGFAWGFYSLLGKRGRAGDATAVTAGNFLRAGAITIALSIGVTLFAPQSISIDTAGVAYAIASGALASGVGYAIWYMALRGLAATTAASVQLSVPVIAAAGGIIFLGETATPRLIIASVAILGGIALVIVGQSAKK